jgi:hypothetical protein
MAEAEAEADDDDDDEEIALVLVADMMLAEEAAALRRMLESCIQQ